MPFETLSSEFVFRGRAFDVRVDQIRLPDGRAVRLDVVDHLPAVTLVPIDAEGRIWFIRQYRHPALTEMIELPAGVLNAGEDPAVGADRELREETGMAAARLEKLGEYYLAPGYSTEKMHAYLARDLSPAPLAQDEDEFIEVVKLPVGEALQLARAGTIQDAKSLAALFLALPYLA
jgi:ADP-ribose pyrophosphatase